LYKKKKYDYIPELNEIIIKEIEQDKIKKKLIKILNVPEEKDFNEFIIVYNQLELENNEFSNKE